MSASKTHLTLLQKREIREKKKVEALKKEWNVDELTDLQVRYLEKNIRTIGYWDIETSDFNPNGNFIIGYAFETRDILTEKIERYEYNITPKDIKDAVDHDSFNFDFNLLQNLSDCLYSVDCAIGHFSTKFDFPFFRTRCLLTEQLDLIPDYGEVKQGDTWRMMKNSLKAPRNTLMNLSIYTKTPNEKTFVDMEHWKRIYFPSNPKWKKSMEYIMDHCRKDVSMTRKAHMKIEKFNTVGATNV